MGLFDRVKTALADAFTPIGANESRELAYLREIFYNRDGGIRRNQFYRLLNSNGDHVGFSFSCVCGAEYQLLHVTDWLGRQHKCPTCKTDFDLLKACGIPTDMPPAQWAQQFAKLPARPRLTGKRATPFVDTWANNAAGDVQWDGNNPSAGWV